MPCVHLTQLYRLCQEQDVRLSSTDLINVVCRQCGKEEVCPDNLMDPLETQDDEQEDSETQDSNEQN